MIQNDDIAKWTEELIESELESGELGNILRICDENFELWTQKLFPVLQAQGKPCYKAVVQLLHRAGCMNANEKMLGTYFSYLRKKRGLTKKTARAPSLTQTRTVDVVPTSVVASPVEASVLEVQASPQQVQAAHPTPTRRADEIAYPHVYAKSSLTPPVEFEDLRDEEDRWRKEAIEGWAAPWSSVDEYVWLGFLQKIEEYNMYNSPKWTANGNNANFRKELGNEQQKNVYDLLKRKVVMQRKI